MTLIAGTKLGRFEILSLIGAGAMGEVYRAKDPKLDRDVAIKVLKSPLTTNKELKRRLKQEAKTIGRLYHRNICILHDIRSEDGVDFLILEFLDGQTLRTRLALGALHREEAIRIGIAVADGLAAAHDADIIHRDLKPSNIFLTKGSDVKIIDFGLALAPEFHPVDGIGEGSTITVLPLSQQVCGTPAYMSPEQVTGKPLDSRSDVFSFGCVLYEMLAGRRAFEYDTRSKTLQAIANTSPSARGEIVSHIPKDFVKLVLRCLEEDPKNRCQSARDVAFMLRDLEQTQVPFSEANSPARVNDKDSATKASQSGDSDVSIAVLSLEDQSLLNDHEYFCDGISTELIHVLGTIEGIAVASRTSTIRYKGSRTDIRTIGAELAVDYVLEGSVKVDAKTLRVLVQLTRVSDGHSIWMAKINKDKSDVLCVQEEIAQALLGKLPLRSGRPSGRTLPRRHTDSNDAYIAYLSGRQCWHELTEPGLRRALTFFSKAIETDPEYALAYSGLADAYTYLGHWGSMRPTEAFPKAKAAALRALSIDASVSDAHTSLIAVKSQYEWDWAGAEREFTEAIKLDKRSSIAHLWYSTSLAATGRLDEALTVAESAQRLEPHWPLMSAHVGGVHFIARRYDAAIEKCDQTLQSYPKFPLAQFIRGMALGMSGMMAECVDQFEHATGLPGGRKIESALLGHAYALSGQVQKAQKMIAQLWDKGKREYVSPIYFAWIATALGDHDDAFAHLQKALVEKETLLMWLNVHPYYDSLRNDQRFAQLLVRMGFPS